MASSADYYRMRAPHCRTMADASANPAARRIHEELSEKCAQQASETEAAHAFKPWEIGSEGVAARKERNARQL